MLLLVQGIINKEIHKSKQPSPSSQPKVKLMYIWKRVLIYFRSPVKACIALGNEFRAESETEWVQEETVVSTCQWKTIWPMKCWLLFTIFVCVPILTHTLTLPCMSIHMPAYTFTLPHTNIHFLTYINACAYVFGQLVINHQNHILFL